VRDEVLARAPLLVGVAIAREREGALYRLALDRLVGVRGVLGDDREQIAEQRALVGVEVLGQRVDRDLGALRRLAGADAQMPAPVLGRLGGAVAAA
jgi:hypothetical protein